MVYNSQKSWVFPAAMCVLLLIAIKPAIDGAWGVLLLPAAIIAWFIWMWFDTYYIIRNGELYYKNSFIKGSIPISAMREIKIHNKGMHACTLKPALALKGLIIKYNRYDDIFISPERQGEFIAQLLTVNPDIKVIS